MKVSFRKIFFFFLAKYFLFYVVLMFKNQNYTLIQIDELHSVEDLIYYLLTFLFLPIFTFSVLSYPLKLTLEKPRKLFWVLFVLLGLEYILYTFLASQTDYLNGVLNTGCSSFTLTVMFYQKVAKNAKIKI